MVFRFTLCCVEHLIVWKTWWDEISSLLLGMKLVKIDLNVSMSSLNHVWKCVQQFWMQLLERVQTQCLLRCCGKQQERNPTRTLGTTYHWYQQIWSTIIQHIFPSNIKHIGMSTDISFFIPCDFRDVNRLLKHLNGSHLCFLFFC